MFYRGWAGLNCDRNRRFTKHRHENLQSSKHYIYLNVTLYAVLVRFQQNFGNDLPDENLNDENISST